ncbi:MAG: calcium/sodium antiporter [Akkermansiaceae bacterium]|jgi:cation:H+ antiporter|nr:calcium/sodium antiporter [Akkermansiaceae bacterium]MDP4647882.1 calcium/sodium antiporter [Akkermansiaceae bacterium]MDP4722012.1 calcium/sodium antiporter [Akkermansiaceae bacterium]MDP4780672.1 calcium/sodium antiporter [Akkermansiaceae bacterium]MDP4897825.1 calcium/sodium antiporter [Akkermansiaceae bacterium]
MTLAIVFLIVGFVLLVFAADYLVKGAASIASAVGISPLVVGLTVVAFGTSAPELAVSVASAFKGQADLAVGNVVGSNIFNILVVVGVSALIIPLVVHRQLIRLDVPVMIFLSGLVYFLSMDGLISRLDGAILFSMAIGYVGLLLWKSKHGGKAPGLDELDGLVDGGNDPKWAKNIFLIVIGIAGLTGGSHLLVKGAVEIATYFGVSELVIGLTIISVGTSLPEVATSVMAAIKGERDIAIGNVVGSNIFNIVTVLGLSSIVAPNGIGVAQAALDFDMLFMIAIALAAFPVFFLGYRVGRISGFFFVSFYVAYVVYLLLGSTENVAFPAYREVVLHWAAPITAGVLAIMLVRALLQGKNPA